MNLISLFRISVLRQPCGHFKPISRRFKSMMSEKMIPLKNVDEHIRKQPRFTILTYNCLASDLAEPRYFPHTNPIHLEFSYRSKLFEKELKSFNADIVCLQEIHKDDFNQWLRPFLAQLDYDEGSFAERGGEKAKDGVVIFFKKDKFKLISKHRIGYYDLAHAQFPQPSTLATYNTALFCLIQFLNIETDASKSETQQMWISTTHLNWNYNLPATQIFQIRTLLNELTNLSKDTPNSPFVIVGDFNSTRDSPVHDYIKNGYLTDKADYFSKLQEVYLPLFEGDANRTSQYLTEPHHYKKALESVYNKETFLMPFSTRIADHYCGTIDYIYYQHDRLRPLQVLNALQGEEEQAYQEDFTLPNEQHPSDHLPLMAELALLPYARTHDSEETLVK